MKGTMMKGMYSFRTHVNTFWILANVFNLGMSKIAFVHRNATHTLAMLSTFMMHECKWRIFNRFFIDNFWQKFFGIMLNFLTFYEFEEPEVYRQYALYVFLC